MHCNRCGTTNNGITESKNCRLCKECAKKGEWKHTPEGLINRIYLLQKRSSVRRGHGEPEYTCKELIDWSLSRSNFDELYTRWFDAGRPTDLVPSIDRLDDSKGYSFDNIQLITWKENNDKQNRVNCRMIVNEDGLEFISIKQAASWAGVNPPNISKALRTGGRSGGKRWSYNG